MTKSILLNDYPYTKLHTDDVGLLRFSLPVDGVASTHNTIRWIMFRAYPGDILVIDAQLDVTNDVGIDPVTRVRTGTKYNVGIGMHFNIYDANAPAAIRPSTHKIIASRGMNVTPDIHHLAMDMRAVYQVPEDWNSGNHICIQLKIDAHSSAWQVNGGNDVIEIENYGYLFATQYTKVVEDG